MSKSPPIHIFRAGRHTAMSGDTIAFSAADLKAAADAYDPRLHEAPIVVGHPTADAPAYGWVSRLAYTEDGLQAEPAQLDETFAELVRNGRFKKVSASFYRPDSQANPKPGVYYLRHVGFLGAQPPAIKGLKQAEFSEDAEGVIEFAELGDMLESTVWARLTDGLQQLLRRLIDNPQLLAADNPADMPAENFRESKATAEETHTVTKEEIERREAELKAQAEAQAKKDAEFAEREAKIKAEEAQFAARAAKARRADITEFVEGLVEAGRVLPRDSAPLAEFMAGIQADAVVEFAEDGQTLKKPSDEWLRDFLGRLPEQVDYAERGTGEDPDTGTAGYDAPAGYSVDPRKAKTHRMALAYAEKHKVDYVAAVRAVSQSA